MPRILSLEAVTGAVAKLRQRIEERFPGSDLATVASELDHLARNADRRARRIARSSIVIRLTTTALLLAMVGVVAYGATDVRVDLDGRDPLSIIQAADSALSCLVFLGGIALFLASLDGRRRRKLALDALYELRSFAHVVDLHQLTKDPERSMRTAAENTPSSPRDNLTPFLLGRFLDYCSELLALSAKVAVFYVQDARDDVVLRAADDIESLTNGLARSIWQKIMVLDRLVAQGGEKGV